MGSTRLRAGTATKMVLNTLTTGAMILMGKTMGDLMVDLNPSNEKLRLRAVRIVSLATGVSIESAGDALQSANGQVKTAIVSLRTGISTEDARKYLSVNGGKIMSAILAINSGANLGDQKEKNLGDQKEKNNYTKTVVAVGIDGGGTALKIRLSIKEPSSDSNKWLRTEVSIGNPALPS